MEIDAAGTQHPSLQEPPANPPMLSSTAHNGSGATADNPLASNPPNTEKSLPDASASETDQGRPPSKATASLETPESTDPASAGLTKEGHDNIADTNQSSLPLSSPATTAPMNEETMGASTDAPPTRVDQNRILGKAASLDFDEFAAQASVVLLDPTPTPNRGSSTAHSNSLLARQPHFSLAVCGAS